VKRKSEKQQDSILFETRLSVGMQEIKYSKLIPKTLL
jgi:hypothetical protein